MRMHRYVLQPVGGDDVSVIMDTSAAHTFEAHLPPGAPLLGEVRAAIADTGGGVPAERAISAGSDLRLYAAAGIPTLHYGPGDLHLAHGPGERVPVSELVTAARAFALLAVRTCGVR